MIRADKLYYSTFLFSCFKLVRSQLNIFSVPQAALELGYRIMFPYVDTGFPNSPGKPKTLVVSFLLPILLQTSRDGTKVTLLKIYYAYPKHF